VLLAGCVSTPHESGPGVFAHENFFAVTGSHKDFGCDQCHPPAVPTFTAAQGGVSCSACHIQPATDAVHATAVGYGYKVEQCIACHRTGAVTSFDHASLAMSCAFCHDVGGYYAALPVAGFIHPNRAGTDCGACHSTQDWLHAVGVPALASDPLQGVVVHAQIPTYAGTYMASLTASTETLPMPMNHSSKAIAAADMATCIHCHAQSPASIYPGRLHGSVSVQPTTCLDCHATSAPRGFVGATATNPARTPPSGEMKHDAVLWQSGAPTVTTIVTQDCSLCHVSPPAASGWATMASYHSALSGAGQSEPSQCLDCHANTRPTTVLSSANASLAANVTLDHLSSALVAECAACHTDGSPTQFASWASGRFHLSASSAPTACLPCHLGDRPTSSAAWVNTGYASSPFDYGTSSQGATHGDGQDCAVCHANSGTGVWGGTPPQNWAAGHFAHGSGTVAAQTCIACHASQRPDLVLGTVAALAAVGFDHSTMAGADCFSCHQATVAAGSYVSYYKSGTTSLPGGDWQGGASVPATIVVGEFTIAQPPATTSTTQAGINNLPHPTVGTTACTVCHSTAAGSKPALGYDHGSALIAGNCSACHEAGSDLVATVWNGASTTSAGQGDTRPFTVALTNPCAVAASSLHFYSPQGTSASLGDCGMCHLSPSGIAVATTGTAYSSAWSFHHPPQTDSERAFPCSVCHVSANCGN